MDGVTALVAGLLTALHRATAPDVCPGGWPWAVSQLGLLVGLLPGVGALLVALLRKVTGNSATVISAAIGFVFAGLLPLIVFSTAGRIFSAASAGTAVPGLGRAGLRADACFSSLRIPGRVPGPRDGRAGLRWLEPAASGRGADRAGPRARHRRDVHLRPGAHRAPPRSALARHVLLAAHARRRRAHPVRARPHRGAPVARRGRGCAARHVPAAARRPAVLGEHRAFGEPARPVRRPRSGSRGSGSARTGARASAAPSPASSGAPSATPARVPPPARHPCYRPTLVAPVAPGAAPERSSLRRRQATVPADPQAGLRRVRPGLARPRPQARPRRRAQGRARPGRGDRAAHPARGPRARRRPPPELRADLRHAARAQRSAGCPTWTAW